jgi:twitching motility protein PilT
MAQLDRFLSVLVGNRGGALLLAEGDVVKVDVGGAARPVTKQPLAGAQLLMLLREIAPADAARQLEGGRAVSFRYESPDGAFAVRATPTDGRWAASLRPEGGAAPDAPAAATSGAFPALSTSGVFPSFDSVRGGGAPTATRAAAPPSAPAVPAAAPAPARRSGEVAVAEPEVDELAKKRMDSLLRLLVEQSASDLHLRVGEPPILRRHGEMQRLADQPVLDNEQLEAMLMTIMPERNRREFRELSDTDYAYEIEGCARFRANALRDRRGAAAVFRVIPATVVSVEQMGISTEVQNLCYLTKGLVLVTGPTGSGKSTTLCALVDLVNRGRNDHVITIEDPIEFVHPNKNCIITQRQVGVHTNSFKHALRAALREDPDIILVGELRDLETVSIAIETAETGHLVFGTLHTTTAASTIDRIIDQFPADRQSQIRVMLSESLRGVISQTLCKKIGGGRVAAREILLTTPAISNLIREGKTFQIPSIIQTSRKLGMLTLNDALIDLVDAKQVDPKEAYMKSVEKMGFLQMLKSRSIDTSWLDGVEAAAQKGKESPKGEKAKAAGR